MQNSLYEIMHIPTYSPTSLLCYNSLMQKGGGLNKYRNTNYRNAVTKVTARKKG